MERPAVINIDLDFLRTSIRIALDNMQLGINDYLEQEIKACVSDGHLTSIIQQQVRDGVTRAVGSAVCNYFTYGEAAEVLKEVVQGKIKEVLDGRSK